MTESGSEHTSSRLGRRIPRSALLVLLCVCGIALLALKLYLNSPYAAALASRLLSSYLHQPVRIHELNTSGSSLTLKGVTLGNPPGTVPGEFLEVDSLTIAPQWGDLLRGKRRLRLLALSGIRLDLRKNASGAWNFSELQKRFSGTKPSGEELFIGQLSISGGAIQVNGQGVKGITLQLSNLSTKGSGDAGIELSFEDAARSRYTISGKARPGSDPAFELALAAPSLSLSGLYGMLNKAANPLFEGLTGGLNMTAGLQEGTLRVTGQLTVTRPSPHPAALVPAPTCSLDISASYDIARDQARLDELRLRVNDLVTAHASGTADRLRSERRFNLELGFNPVDLARVAALLPEKERQGTRFGGSLSGSAVQLSGSALQGVTRAAGTLQLRDGSFERGGRLYFSGLGSHMAITRGSAGFRVIGKLSLKSNSSTALLESLAAPFGVTLSKRFKLVSAEMPSLAAVSRGVRVSGRLGFVPTANTPLAISLRATVPAAAALQPLLGKRDLQIASGSASLTLDATGRGQHDFKAVATARIRNLQATQAGHGVGLKNGSVDSRVRMQQGTISISGQASLDGLARDARSGVAQFSYRFADDLAAVENVKITIDDLSLEIARLSARISPAAFISDASRYPVKLELSGGEVRRGQVGLNGVSGSLRGTLASDSAGRWLDGTADLSATAMVWQGKPVASPAVHAAFFRAGVQGTVSAMLLGGALDGHVSLKFSGLESAFRCGLKGVRLNQVGELLPRRGTSLLSDGTLDASLSGNYSRNKGVASRFDLAGTGISMTGSGGKTLLAGGGLALAGELTGTTLHINNALFKVGEGVSLTLKGELKNSFVAQREGRFTYGVQQAPLTSMIDPFMNLLPRFIQEATVDGSVATAGTIVFRDGSQLLEGALQFTNVLIEVPSQKFKAEAISGSLPFSLDLSGKKAFKMSSADRFTRENYSRLLGELRRETGKGQPLRVGSVSFGSLNLGEVQLRTSAADGITQFISLHLSLYDGAILGRGLVVVRDGINYRADLLINGLSLKQFCASIPKIKDYISGRLDGVISINGAGKGVAGMTGFTELWVREGSGEKMLVSKTFLQKLSGKQLSGFFFRSDRPFDQAEIAADLQDGYLTFEKLDISNTNLFGVRDLSVTVAPAQNRIALDHLFEAVKQASVRGKAAVGEAAPTQAPTEPEFKWQE
jgi:hypothetical protein